MIFLHLSELNVSIVFSQPYSTYCVALFRLASAVAGQIDRARVKEEGTFWTKY